MTRDLNRIARLLGGDVVGRDSILAPGPAPHSPRDRSLSIRFDPYAPGGFHIFSFCGDDWRVCRDHVRAALGLSAWQPDDERRRVIPPPERIVDPRRRIDYARRLWSETRDPRNTLAEKYWQSRGLDLSDALAGHALRFHPRCAWRDETTGDTIRIPALIACYRSIDDDSITAIHRIGLNSDASKCGRRALGVVARAAIKLDPIGETLAIGEGVESAAAARQLGFAPAWALGSVGAISRFPVIDGIRQLTILGEAGDISAKAIEICAARWRAAGRVVCIVLPPVGCSDLNDVLIAKVAG
jgi:putative DNA primase/helicase